MPQHQPPTHKGIAVIKVRIYNNSKRKPEQMITDGNDYHASIIEEYNHNRLAHESLSEYKTRIEKEIL